MRSATAGRTSSTAFTAITIDAASAAQSSAASQPGPRITAIEIPTNAAADVSASLKWCWASVRTAVLPISEPTVPTRRDNSTLIAITTTSTSSVHHAGAWCGVLISRMASIAIPIAAPSSMSATAAPASASALP